LHLTWPDREIGVAQHKTADDIGASGNRLQRQLADRSREPFISNLLLATASGAHRWQADKWLPRSAITGGQTSINGRRDRAAVAQRASP
jgi:hypothetical protein